MMHGVLNLFVACAQAYSGLVYEIAGPSDEFAQAARDANKHNTAYAFPTFVGFTHPPTASRLTLVKLHGTTPEDELQGLLGLLKTHRPIVFCEVGAASRVRALDTLRRRTTYMDVQLHPQVAVIGKAVDCELESPHHILVPFEKLATVGQLLRDAGYALRDEDGAEIPVT
jgi:hypothetical protein